MRLTIIIIIALSFLAYVIHAFAYYKELLDEIERETPNEYLNLKK